MGIFGSDTKQESKIVINLSTFASDGHALLVTNQPVRDKMHMKRHLVTCFPRDYNESKDDYDKRIKKEFNIPVQEGFLLVSPHWSEFKEMIFIMPNSIFDLPKGLNEDLKDAFEYIITKKNTEQTIKEMLWHGITERDEILKQVAGLEFFKDLEKQKEKLVDDAMVKIRSQPVQMPKTEVKA